MYGLDYEVKRFLWGEETAGGSAHGAGAVIAELRNNQNEICSKRVTETQTQIHAD